MLMFGTSGLRGLVTEMTDQECYINTLGYLHYLIQSKQIDLAGKVSLAGDLRFSTDRIMQAVGKAVTDSGCIPENCGKLPSPAVMIFAMEKNQASIMITGSHIPDDRNGIKFNKPSGEILKADEPGILDKVAKVRVMDLSALFDRDGNFLEGIERKLPEVNRDAEKKYRDRYTEGWPVDILQGKRIVVDQHSAVGRDMLCDILEYLGAEVIREGRTDTFVPKDTENITEATKAGFKALAEKYQPFAIVSTDGDSDRPFVVDETGVFHRGDVLGAVVARYIGARFAAVPISANDAIDVFLEETDIERVQTRIGSPYVIAAMQKGMDEGKTPVVGWEVNGGFMLATDVFVGGKTLKALPTRDAVFPTLCALLAGINEGSMSKLFGGLPQRFTQAGLIDDFPVATSRRLISGFKSDDSIMQINYDESKQSLLYYDGHIERSESYAEAVSQQDLDAFWELTEKSKDERIIKKIVESNYFTSDRGFGEVIRMNMVDGIRIVFSNHDVAHIRPSGNAPQLRIYSNADSQQRADEIVSMGLAKDGFLRAMEKDINQAGV
ncbi:phosphomannomutase [bacterium]|nr:phosphomannomutase [bacterium]